MLQEYLAKNIFLADINNEGEVKNETYKQNLITLNNLVLIQFEYDITVCFGFRADMDSLRVRSCRRSADAAAAHFTTVVRRRASSLATSPLATST